jgi:hypothetical protein
LGLALDGFMGSLLANRCHSKNLPSDFQNALWMLFIGFHAWLHPKNFTFVDYKLAIFAAHNLKAI